MKTFRYEIPVWHIDQTPVDLDNPPEHWQVFTGQAIYEDLEDAWDCLVEQSPYVVDIEEVVVEEKK